jgi:hypothetical protein
MTATKDRSHDCNQAEAWFRAAGAGGGSAAARSPTIGPRFPSQQSDAVAKGTGEAAVGGGAENGGGRIRTSVG